MASDSVIATPPQSIQDDGEASPGLCRLKSMTGFGRAQNVSEAGELSVEVRAVNNRFHDLSLALPRDLSALESPVRALLKQRVRRGKIDMRIRYNPAEANQPQVSINLSLAEEYALKLKALARIGGSGELPVQVLTGLPGVMEIMPAEIDEEELWILVRNVIEQALTNFDRERCREGAALGAQMLALTAGLKELHARAEGLKDEVVNRFRERLTSRLAQFEEQLRDKLDPGRLATEVALFAEKADINEELVRLAAHLERFDALLRNEPDDSVGKNLDFLLQEIGREINTICSKSRETQLTSVWLEMKNIAEQLREQIQNIE